MSFLHTLTVRQPWAWAIAKGYKPIENRGWTTKYRGPLAIHSAAKWDDFAEDSVRFVRDLARAQGSQLPERLADDLPLSSTGHVIAIVDLVDICTVRLRADIGARCDCGPWAQGAQAHWRLANVRLLPDSIPAKGHLGLWMLPTPSPQNSEGPR